MALKKQEVEGVAHLAPDRRLVQRAGRGHASALDAAVGPRNVLAVHVAIEVELHTGERSQGSVCQLSDRDLRLGRPQAAAVRTVITSA